jgi:hypothetical protein
MSETMGSAERTARTLYATAATVYFCLPEVTLTGALSFAAVALVLIVTTATGLQGLRPRPASEAFEIVDKFTA